MKNKLMKKLNKKGFTLAELLIVVAIIAVLVAISIPIFTSQLEKSRDAVTESNVRAAYAQAQTAWLTSEVGTSTVDGMTVTKAEGDTGSVVVPGVKIMGQQDNGGFDSWPFSFTAGAGAADALDVQADHTGTSITFTYATAGAEPTITVG